MAGLYNCNNGDKKTFPDVDASVYLDRTKEIWKKYEDSRRKFLREIIEIRLPIWEFLQKI